MKDEKYLHQFRVVAEHQCISTACNELYISQSALTKNIKKIEDRLGVLLFERLPRGVRITEYGEALLSRVKKMELEYSYAINEITSIKTGNRAKLNIGAELIWGETVLPEIMHKMYERYPSAEIDLIGGSVSDLAHDLVEGKIDLLLGSMDYMFHENDRVTSTAFMQSTHLILVHKTHPLADIESITPEQLHENDWVLYQKGINSKNSINAYFAQNALPPIKALLKTSFLDVAFSMLEKRQCLLCLPSQFISKIQIEEYKVLPLSVPFQTFHTGVWTTDTSRDSRSVKEFIDVIQTHSNKSKTYLTHNATFGATSGLIR